MKRLLTLLIVLALVGYLGFKGGIWWLADQRFSELNQALSGVGVVDPGRIGSGIQGSLVLQDAQYQDFRLARPLSAGRLVFEAGSPMVLATTLMNPAAMPPSWTLQGEQLAMVFSDSFFSHWVVAAQESRAFDLFALVCGPDHRQKLNIADLLSLGIPELTGEALLRQDAEGLYAELTTAEAGSVEVTWPGARFDLLAPGELGASTSQPLKLNLRDGGLMRRLSAYCSREAGLETDEWVGVVVDYFRSKLSARQLEPSRQLIALYRKWLTEGGELEIELNPSRPLWGVPVAQPDKPFITYNGSQVPDVYLTKIQPQQTPVPEEVVEPIVGTSTQPETGWRPVDIGEASTLMGQTVRVTLANGNQVEGRLASVDEKRLEVIRLMAGGEVTYPIAIRMIDSFEVWRRNANP